MRRVCRSGGARKLNLPDGLVDRVGRVMDHFGDFSAAV